MKTRIMIVFGTRPEAIKMAPVVKAFQAAQDFETVVCVTAQHRSMLDQVLEVFDISPDHDLDIMRPGQTLTSITASILKNIEAVMEEVKPDWVLVHGDTTTAMTTALAAFYQQIPVGHVEAGLRTGDLSRPWPEEMNRKFIDAIAAQLWAPTEGAREALLKENAVPELIAVTGNTVIDALIEVSNRIHADASLGDQLGEQFRMLDPARKLVVVTGHRRESFGEGLERICRGLLELAEDDGVEIIYPVHLNQNVKGPVERLLGGQENIHLIDPLDYVPFVYLINRARIIITDSGGVQEEAPSLGKPVLVTRDVTERPEAVEAGTALLVGTDDRKIVESARRLLFDEAVYQAMSNKHNPYGDGRASQRIVERLRSVTKGSIAGAS